MGYLTSRQKEILNAAYLVILEMMRGLHKDAPYTRRLYRKADDAAFALDHLMAAADDHPSITPPPRHGPVPESERFPTNMRCEINSPGDKYHGKQGWIHDDPGFGVWVTLPEFMAYDDAIAFRRDEVRLIPTGKED